MMGRSQAATAPVSQARHDRPPRPTALGKGPSRPESSIFGPTASERSQHRQHSAAYE
ncbi:hypothetical protein CGMCC3_g8566 [Colletotrichum fructicola]|nr:uncharacterized protein CGMCC3_g8566 [Colletotrichum fructicola]KAE9575339.1 hypothetical protein CGMCC3_g8566 [Colletotrichum fructicola]